MDFGKLTVLCMGMGAWYAGCGVVAMGFQRTRNAVATRFERWQYTKSVLGGSGSAFMADFA